MNAARVLREARRRAGLTQRELAAKAGVAHSQVARIERGHTVPRVDTLDELLEACGEGLYARARFGIGVDRTMYQDVLAFSPLDRVRQIESAADELYRIRSRIVAAEGRAAEKPPTKLEWLIDVLARHEVRYVVIGGVAAVLQGSNIVTKDLDVCYARDEENLRRLAAALIELEAYLRGAPPGVPFVLDAATLRNGMNFTFSTAAGPFDCLGEPAGVAGYAELLPNAKEVLVGRHVVRVAALSDVIRMKQAAGRPKDRIQVENFVALQEELDRGLEEPE